MKYDISISINGWQKAYGDFEALNMAKAVGVNVVDFSTEYNNVLEKYSIKPSHDLYRRSVDEIASYFEKVKKHADSLGIRIAQTHGRIKAYTYDEEHNAAELLGMSYDTLAASILGVPYIVIHNVHVREGMPDEDSRKYNARMWDDYMPLAHKYGVAIASETLGGSLCMGRADEFFGSFESIRQKNGNEPHICFCMDTGHSNCGIASGDPPIEEQIHRMGSNLKCLHLHDNDGRTDQHLLPYAGTINWETVMGALRDVGYSGTYNMELNLGRFGSPRSIRIAYAEFAVKVMREMLNKYYGE